MTDKGLTVLLHASAEHRGVWARVAARMIKCGLHAM
jgi:hypothetical protein